MTAIKHRWDRENKRAIAAASSPSQCDQTERDCKICGLVMITVHPPREDSYRAWRYPDDPKQFTSEATPPCRGVAEAMK